MRGRQGLPGRQDRIEKGNFGVDLPIEGKFTYRSRQSISMKLVE